MCRCPNDIDRTIRCDQCQTPSGTSCPPPWLLSLLCLGSRCSWRLQKGVNEHCKRSTGVVWGLSPVKVLHALDLVVQSVIVCSYISFGCFNSLFNKQKTKWNEIGICCLSRCCQQTEHGKYVTCLSESLDWLSQDSGRSVCVSVLKHRYSVVSKKSWIRDKNAWRFFSPLSEVNRVQPDAHCSGNLIN